MAQNDSTAGKWTVEQVEAGRKSIAAWDRASVVFEDLRRESLSQMKGNQALEKLWGSLGPALADRALSETSGLIDQQFWFMKVARHD